MRDNALLGPIALAAGLAVPRQAHSATTPFQPFFARRPLLSAGKLPAVQEGGRDEPWKCWS